MRGLFGAAGLMGVLAIGIVIGMASRPLPDERSEPTPVATAPATSKPTLIPATPIRAQQDVVLRPTARPAPRDVTLEVTESELADELNARLAGRSLGATPLGDATAETFTATLRGGRVEIGGNARVGLFGAPFLIVGDIRASDRGRPVVRVSDARVGGVPMPEPSRSSIEQTIQTEIDQQLVRQPVHVRTVEIGDGRLRMTGAPAS
jgi:hypothetical protein